MIELDLLWLVFFLFASENLPTWLLLLMLLLLLLLGIWILLFLLLMFSVGFSGGRGWLMFFNLSLTFMVSFFLLLLGRSV